MDTLSSGNSVLHRIDPRAKVFTTLIFIITVVSFNRYTILSFVPFMVFPIAQISAGKLPAGYLLKKVVMLSPLALAVGIFNPLLDHAVLYRIGTIDISGGWVSLFSIFFRFVLTASAALVLVALTGFNQVCRALTSFGVPRPFVAQLFFIYRYIFVLSDESQRMEQARVVRSFDAGNMRYRTFIPLIGHLLLRTLDRAERIYCAMCCRGFDGTFRMFRMRAITGKDICFVVSWSSLFMVFRFLDVTAFLGRSVLRLLP